MRLTNINVFSLLGIAAPTLLVAVAGGAPKACAPCDPDGGPAKGGCLLACEAARKLNEKWLRQAEGDWTDTQFWGSGNAVQALTDYSLYSDALIGSRVFEMEPVIRGIFKARGTLKIELLGIGSYDDMQWWSLAYANAGVLLKDSAMVSSASAVFDHVWGKAYSNSSKECNGGLWWSSKRHYKNAITNELAVATAAVLHKATGEQRYLEQALAQWHWFENSGMLNHKTGAICDGLGIDKSTFKCSGSGKTSYTYNQGVILGGLAHLYDITKDQSLLDSAHVIANGTMSLYTTAGGILQEENMIHDRDAALFKGIFMRNLRLLIEACVGPGSSHYSHYSPNVERAEVYGAFIKRNVASMVANARTADGLYGAYWQGPVDPHAAGCQQPGKAECGNATGTVPQISALELLSASIQV